MLTGKITSSNLNITPGESCRSSPIQELVLNLGAQIFFDEQAKVILVVNLRYIFRGKRFGEI